MATEYIPEEDGNALIDLDYLTATKYVLGAEVEGDPEWNSHTHVFYLRDDLPVATTDAEHYGVHHAHSIEEGPDNTVICKAAAGHIHTVLTVEEAGDYTVRTLFEI